MPSRFLLLLCAFLSGYACTTRANARDALSGLQVPCRDGADTDLDGLSDACEVAFARAFAPLLRIAPATCHNGVPGESALPSGGYLFGVQPLGTDSRRILYLPAYHEDCGWRGFKCTLGLTSCRGHSGDSELIALDVVRQARGWTTSGVFLSAHCFGRSDASCRWYRQRGLDDFEWLRALRDVPVVWVAQGKNANYPSRSACDAGHWFYDTCDRNEIAIRFPVHAQRNIGSAHVPIGGDGCVTREELEDRGTAGAAPTEECFWSDVPFTGWQHPAHGWATPYVRYLRMLFQDVP